MSDRNSRIVLFDVDGTLTEARRVIEPHVLAFLEEELLPRYSIGLVGGSDLPKITEQMSGKQVLETFDYVFPENGLLALSKNKEIGRESIQAYLGEEKIQTFINFCLRYMSEIKLPVKRGTFIEFRNGLINVSPVGRSCSREERNAFEAYDRQHKIRHKFIEALEKEFPDIGLKYSIGGQISFDAFPFGWDKTYCLRYLDRFKTIHFFGDRTFVGGNDYEIFEHPRTIGHTTTGPADTLRMLREILAQPDS